MFKKLYESLNTVNPIHLVLELIIVFIGVYLAFMLSNFQMDREEANDRERVLELLNIGFNRYENIFLQFAQGHESRNKAFRESLNAGEIPVFGDEAFPAP